VENEETWERVKKGELNGLSLAGFAVREEIELEKMEVEEVLKPYPNEHAARVRDPKDFDPKSFRRKRIKDGISVILGKLKGEKSMTVQSYRFDKKKFTAEAARKWLKDHDVNYQSFEAAKQEEKKSMVKTIKGWFSKGVKEKFDQKQLRDLTWALVETIEQVLSDEGGGDKKARIRGEVEEYLKLMEGLSLEKEGKVFSKKNLEKIRAAYQVLSELLELVQVEEQKKMEKEKVKDPVQKGEPDEIQKTVQECIEKERDSIIEAVKKEIKEALKPITERVEKLEKTPLGKMSLDIDGDGGKEERTVWI
jgi:hypothetical protein